VIINIFYNAFSFWFLLDHLLYVSTGEVVEEDSWRD